MVPLSVHYELLPDASGKSMNTNYNKLQTLFFNFFKAKNWHELRLSPLVRIHFWYFLQASKHWNIGSLWHAQSLKNTKYYKATGYDQSIFTCSINMAISVFRIIQLLEIPCLEDKKYRITITEVLASASYERMHYNAMK